MTYTIQTHDAWGIVKVGGFQSLAEARQAFATLCADPWYRSDGTVRGVELVDGSQDGASQRLDWLAFQ